MEVTPSFLPIQPLVRDNQQEQNQQLRKEDEEQLRQNAQQQQGGQQLVDENFELTEQQRVQLAQKSEEINSVQVAPAKDVSRQGLEAINAFSQVSQFSQIKHDDENGVVGIDVFV